MDKINDMLNRQIMRNLFGAQSEPETGTYTGKQAGVYEEVMKALNKVKSIPEPKTTYCSWAFFVKLLMAGNNTITDGHFLSKSSWRFELDGCIEFYVSEIIPVDDKGLQFKKNVY